MVELHLIPGGRDDSDESPDQPEQKPTLADMHKGRLTDEEQRVLLLGGKSLPSISDVIEHDDTKRRRVKPGAVPQITSLREIELRAMKAIVQMQKPDDSEK